MRHRNKSQWLEDKDTTGNKQASNRTEHKLQNKTGNSYENTDPDSIIHNNK